MIATIRTKITNLWKHPLASQIDVNEESALEVHRRMIESKPLLMKFFLMRYREFLPALHATEHLSGPIIEVGSGAGFMERVIPQVIKTDILPSPYIDRVMNAMDLDYEDEELRAIFLNGVFHHIAEPIKFFSETQRCLQPGGRLVIVDPNNNYLSHIWSKSIDHYEYYDDKVQEWESPVEKRMTHANLAIAWVIFFRDRKRFEAEFPRLKIKNILYHTFLSYVVTGGMSYRQIIPTCLWPLIRLEEFLLHPFMKWLGGFMTIEIEKV